MGKYLNGNGGIGADVADLLPAQLPAQHYPLQTHGGAQLHPGKGVDGHLGGAVNLHLRRDLAAQLHHAQILHDKCVHACPGGEPDQLRKLGTFPVGYQRVQGQVDGNAPDVAVLQSLLQRLGREIFGTLPRVEAAAAQINGICPVLDRSPQGIHGPRRRQ